MAARTEIYRADWRRGRVASLAVFENEGIIETDALHELARRRGVFRGLAGKTHDECRADGQIRTNSAPAADLLQGLFLRGGPFHPAQHIGTGMLKGNVQIGEYLAFGHQRNDLIDMRVWVDVMQPHPHTKLTERARKIEESCAHLAAFPVTRCVLDVDSIGRRVLGNNQQLLYAGRDQTLAFAQHVGRGPRDQIAT